MLKLGMLKPGMLKLMTRILDDGMSVQNCSWRRRVGLADLPQDGLVRIQADPLDQLFNASEKRSVDSVAARSVWPEKQTRDTGS